jgi:flavin-dependent thymidylate synthase
MSRDEYKGEMHYWTEDADGDPVRHITKSPLRPGKWYREHTVQELRDEHAWRGLALPQEGSDDVERLAQSLMANDKARVKTGKTPGADWLPEPAVRACPTCGSNAPERHPAVQHEGEVSICRNPWHSSTHAGREALNKAIGHAYADQQKSASDERKTVQKWSDSAMYTAEPIDPAKGPQVHLLWMTPDPLAAIAASSAIYEGKVKRSLRDVTHAERREYIEQIKATKLKAPFEFVKFHFLIEGVTRAFTHQMVRQRTAVYAQESLRFAVKEDMPVALPSSLAGTEGGAEKRVREAFGGHKLEFTTGVDGWEADDAVSQAYLDEIARIPREERQRERWDAAVRDVGRAYKNLVEAGMPAEDARGLLPHNVLTRLHYSTDLRALLDHAGNRLCTQAQFEWRLVFAKIAEAIRNYNPYAQLQEWAENAHDPDNAIEAFIERAAETDRWQYEAISDLFRPVCYQTGKCEFMAEFDRKCSIRNRVQANHEVGRPSSEWSEELDAVEGNPVVSGVGPQSVVRGEGGRPVFIGPIRPAEWLLNPGAAR